MTRRQCSSRATSAQRPRIKRTNASFVCGDEIQQEIMDMSVRVAGNRGVEEVSLSPRSVLDVKCWPGRVVTEADPPDRAGVSAVFTDTRRAVGHSDVSALRSALSMPSASSIRLSKSQSPFICCNIVHGTFFMASTAASRSVSSPSPPFFSGGRM